MLLWGDYYFAVVWHDAALSERREALSTPIALDKMLRVNDSVYLVTLRIR